ncbi:TPA: hypothetical protein HA265_03505 [Candidatus Woesearchaeota archaeon]|nr:hypothetical protein [Candidatus Woesearchaeota archaeon]
MSAVPQEPTEKKHVQRYKQKMEEEKQKTNPETMIPEQNIGYPANIIPKESEISASSVEYPVEPKKISHIFDKKLIIPLLIILILLAAISIFLLIQTEKTPEVEIKTVEAKPQENETILFIPGTDEELQEFEGIIRGDAEIVVECEELYNTEGPDALNKCYIRWAVEYETPQYCLQIEKEEGAESAGDCLTQVALNISDPEICGLIWQTEPDYSPDACYHKLALQDKKAGYCLLIENENGHNSKETCFSNLSMTENEYLVSQGLVLTEDDCRNLPPDGLREDVCYYSLALQTGNLTYCIMIPEDDDSTYFIDECIHDLALEFRVPQILCEMIGDENTWARDDCYQQGALQTLNSDLCKNITAKEGSISVKNCTNLIADMIKSTITPTELPE